MLSPEQEPNYSRHTDQELLEYRMDMLQEVIVPELLESPLCGQFNNWQRELAEGLSKVIEADQTVDLPTRTGKSYFIRALAHTAQAQGARVAIVSHRRHILDDHADALNKGGAACINHGERQSDESGMLPIEIISTQAIARKYDIPEYEADLFDLVLIDEVHMALGEKTVERSRGMFPNAVRISFTATPDFAKNRSVVDEYGSKIISRSIVEAVKEGKVPPVRLFLYKTDAEIDDLDPNFSEFTARELKRLANFSARNIAITNLAQDLVQDGRQGLITTVPGGGLLHASLLTDMISERSIKHEDGTETPIRAQVVRGGDKNLSEILENYESGGIDVLLYCDVLREGTTLKRASFLINGRPRASIVGLTQDIGRILQPKDGEMIVVDFLDRSVKQQCTAYDVLELDRATQAVLFKSGAQEPTDENEQSSRNSYLRRLFRADIANHFAKFNNALILELNYSPEQLSPYEKRQAMFIQERTKEMAKQSRIWEKLLAKEGLKPDQPDHFGIQEKSTTKAFVREEDYIQIDTLYERNREDIVWAGIEHNPIIVPPVLTEKEMIENLHPLPRIQETTLNPENDKEIMKSFLRTELDKTLDTLDQRETAILRTMFGFDDGTPKSLEEVGIKFNLTRERIRQVSARAVAKLRHPQRETGLRAFISENYGETGDHKSSVMTSVEQQKDQNQQIIADRDNFYKLLSTDQLWSKADAADRTHMSNFVRELAKHAKLAPYDFNGRTSLLRRLTEADTKADYLNIRKFYLDLQKSGPYYFGQNKEQKKKYDMYEIRVTRLLKTIGIKH